MPFYLDVHRIKGATPEDIAEAHVADLEIQEQYGVRYLKYWFNEERGAVFCLVEAPSTEAAETVHREAHGLVADQILEIDEEAADRYLGGGRESPSGAALLPDFHSERPILDSGFRTIMFTDIEASTSLTNELGDEAAMALLGEHDSIVRAALSDWRGREVKHTGDGIMASFFAATRAVGCATQIQRELARYNREHVELPVRVRIGMSAGEPVEQHRDLFGAAVQLAARACARAEPGQILVSNVIPELCIGKKIRFADQGVAELKGFREPIRLHMVQWDAEPPGR